MEAHSDRRAACQVDLGQRHAIRPLLVAFLPVGPSILVSLYLFEALGELRLHSRPPSRGYLLLELFALPRVVDDLAFGLRRRDSETSGRAVLAIRGDRQWLCLDLLRRELLFNTT